MLTMLMIKIKKNKKKKKKKKKKMMIMMMMTLMVVLVLVVMMVILFLMMMMMMMMMTMIVVMLIWGCVSLLKSKIRSKIRIIRIFRWEKKRCIRKGIIVKCLKGFSWRERKKEKKPKKKLPKCLVLSKSALIQTLHNRFQPWLSNTELLIISHVWKGGICHWTFLFIWNWK